VQLTSTQEGYRAEATNGKYLGVVSGPMPDAPADFPSWGGLDSAPSGAARALIPAASWAEAFKLAPKKERAKPLLKKWPACWPRMTPPSRPPTSSAA
jgi:hypothetical protein